MRSHVLAPSPSVSKRRHTVEDRNGGPAKVSKNQLSDVASNLLQHEETSLSEANAEKISSEPNANAAASKNALDLVRSDSIVDAIKDLSGYQLWMSLKRGIRDKWFGPNPKRIPVADESNSTGRNNRLKILKVLNFVEEQVMTADETETWLKCKVPKREDPEFSSWEANLGTFAIRVEKRAIEKLLELERSCGIIVKKGTNLVSGIAKRIDDLEKAQKAKIASSKAPQQDVPSTLASESSSSSIELPPLPPSIVNFSVSRSSTSSSSISASSSMFAPKPSVKKPQKKANTKKPS